MKFLLRCFFVFFSCTLSAAEQAQQIFEELSASLFQIRLIENASGEKSTIGSGFQISSDGLVATNYHVISGFAQHPDKYRIEYQDINGAKGELELINVDVVNDLAITQLKDTSRTTFFDIAQHAPDKGEELFSLGNPHDLGMIVVPGTYNGLKKESFNDRIHFTGAVNSGMSGGPVVNQSGKVVGVNVASSGNQIGFLIPHDKLRDLLNKQSEQNDLPIAKQISSSLHNNQQRFVKSLLRANWQAKTLGQAKVFAIDVPFIRCWGDSNANNKDALFFTAVSQCHLEESVFLSDSLTTGSFEMEFRWLESDKLSSFRFYHLYEQQIANAGAKNRAKKDDVSEYACQHDIVGADSSSMKNKAILCTRSYKKYPGLYDIIYVGASIDRNQQALISHFTLSGIEQELAQAFTKQFMEAVTWK